MFGEKKKGRRWVLLYILFFCGVLMFESLLLMMFPLHKEINKFLKDLTGWNINLVLMMMIIFGLHLCYIGFLLVSKSIKIKKQDKFEPVLVNRILPIALGILTFATFVSLLIAFGEDSVILLQLFEFYGLFIFVILIACFLLLTFPLWFEIKRILSITTKKEFIPLTKKYLKVGGIIALYLWVLILPYVFQPTNVLRGDLPDKPMIIAHRGGANYAPENTVEAGIYSNSIGADGWEIDVQISNDGVPFLMHDDTLERTTNISAVFPDRIDDFACFFNISDLKKLNAGEWFVNSDPYDNIEKGSVPTSMVNLYQNAIIPTLEDAMIFSNSTDLIVNVDFKQPPSNHPYAYQYFNICLGILEDANIDSRIWITLYNIDTLDYVVENHPNMVAALSFDRSAYLSAEEFLDTDYDMVNTHHGLRNRVFRTYADRGIPVNVWTVDIISRFQQVWTLGVSSVTTNNPQVLIDIEKPFGIIEQWLYILVWVLSELCGLGAVFLVRYIKKRKIEN